MNQLSIFTQHAQHAQHVYLNCSFHNSSYDFFTVYETTDFMISLTKSWGLEKNIELCCLFWFVGTIFFFNPQLMLVFDISCFFELSHWLRKSVKISGCSERIFGGQTKILNMDRETKRTPSIKILAVRSHVKNNGIKSAISPSQKCVNERRCHQFVFVLPFKITDKCFLLSCKH